MCANAKGNPTHKEWTRLPFRYTHPSGEGLALPFVRELVSQSRDVLEGCRRQHWWSEDAEKLESSLDALQKESSQLVRIVRSGGI